MLRVVVGAILASEGWLYVETNGMASCLFPQDDGETTVYSEPCDRKTGTRIEIWFGSALPADDNALAWATRAAQLAGVGNVYTGKTSPYWYDGEAFFEMLQAAGDRPVRDLIAALDGCSGAKAGKIAANFKGRSCSSAMRPRSTRPCGPMKCSTPATWMAWRCGSGYSRRWMNC